MKVLLTGANGFVGSHILDRLLARQIPAVLLLRPSSDRRLIAEPLAGANAASPSQNPSLEVRLGSMDQPASLDAALEGVTHVIHCAGATKALNAKGYFSVNEGGTRNLVEAINRRAGQVERLVHISSLAAAGPATGDRPKRESDPPAPISDYGRSKLAAEQVVVEGCRTGWVIIRPPAVYGPRDGEFLRLFKAVQSHLLPRFGGGRQQLTLVYVEDLAAVTVAALSHPNASREIFFAGPPGVVTAAELACSIASESGTWTIPLPLPNAALWLACRWAEWLSQVTGKPSVLNAQKYAELRADGWVCDVAKLKGELGCECRTTLHEGIAKTRDWYRAHGWLRS